MPVLCGAFGPFSRGSGVGFPRAHWDLGGAFRLCLYNGPPIWLGPFLGSRNNYWRRVWGGWFDRLLAVLSRKFLCSPLIFAC
jgi:hypothetical protein